MAVNVNDRDSVLVERTGCSWHKKHRFSDTAALPLPDLKLSHRRSSSDKGNVEVEKLNVLSQQNHENCHKKSLNSDKASPTVFKHLTLNLDKTPKHAEGPATTPSGSGSTTWSRFSHFLTSTKRKNSAHSLHSPSKTSAPDFGSLGKKGGRLSSGGQVFSSADEPDDSSGRPPQTKIPENGVILEDKQLPEVNSAIEIENVPELVSSGGASIPRPQSIAQVTTSPKCGVGATSTSVIVHDVSPPSAFRDSPSAGGSEIIRIPPPPDSGSLVPRLVLDAAASASGSGGGGGHSGKKMGSQRENGGVVGENSNNGRSPVTTTRTILPPPPEGALRQHSFLVDEADLRKMEQGLLDLLEDFNAGKLKAFTEDNTLKKMKHIRDQQEQLAKLHFELYAEQEKQGTRIGDDFVKRKMFWMAGVAACRQGLGHFFPSVIEETCVHLIPQDRT